MSEGRLAVRVVDVYAYRRAPEGPRFLVLRRSAGRAYAGQWRVVGGKIEAGERAWEAALRELAEETGLQPARFWAVPSANVFYEWEHDRVNVIPAFAAEVAADPATDATTDAEHDGWAWLTPDEAAARLAWPEQQRLLRLAARLLSSGVPPELTIPLA